MKVARCFPPETDTEALGQTRLHASSGVTMNGQDHQVEKIAVPKFHRTKYPANRGVDQKDSEIRAVEEKCSINRTRMRRSRRP